MEQQTAIEIYESLLTDDDRMAYMTRCVIAMDHQTFLDVLTDYRPESDVKLLTLYCQRHHRVTGEPFVVEREWV